MYLFLRLQRWKKRRASLCQEILVASHGKKRGRVEHKKTASAIEPMVAKEVQASEEQFESIGLGDDPICILRLSKGL